MVRCWRWVSPLEGRRWLLLLGIEGWCGWHVVVVIGFGAEGAECEVVDEDADCNYHYDEDLLKIDQYFVTSR